MSFSSSLFLFSLLSPRSEKSLGNIPYTAFLCFLSSLPSFLFQTRPPGKERGPSSSRLSSSTKNAPSPSSKKKTYIKRTKTLFLLLLLLLLQVPPRDPRKKKQKLPRQKRGARSQRTFGYSTVHVPPRMDSWTDSPHSPTPAPAPTRSQLLITRSTHQYQTSDIACSLAAPGFFFLGFFFSSFFLSFCDQSQILFPVISSPLSSVQENLGWKMQCIACLFACLLPALCSATT